LKIGLKIGLKICIAGIINELFIGANDVVVGANVVVVGVIGILNEVVVGATAVVVGVIGASSVHNLTGHSSVLQMTGSGFRPDLIELTKLHDFVPALQSSTFAWQN
jgi:hypothetical protein